MGWEFLTVNQLIEIWAFLLPKFCGDSVFPNHHFQLSTPHFSGELDSNSVEFDRIGFCPKLTWIKQNTLYILHTHNNEVFMKKRVCFTVSDDVLKKLAELAKKENRSMSAMVEQLVRSAK